MVKVIKGLNKETEIIDSLENIKEDELRKKHAMLIFDLFEEKKYEACLINVKKYLESFSEEYYKMIYIHSFCLNELNQKEEAIKILKDELGMPYIPMEYEEKFLDLYNEIRPREEKNKKHNLNDQQMENILLNEENKELIFAVIVELNNLNARKYLFLIQEFFLRDVKNIYKVMLVDVLANQFINHSFKFVNKGIEYNINPVNVKDIMKTQMYIKIHKMLENEFSVKFPDLFNLSNEVLMLYLSEIYPENDNDENLIFVFKAICLYIHRLFKNESEINKITLSNNEIKIIDDIILILEIACHI